MIPFHPVKKSPLIIGIVDRIKINSEQPLPFSESELSIPYFLQIVCMTYVCFVYFAAIAQVCIDLYTVMVWKGIQVPRGNIGKTTKKKRWRKRQSRSCRFSFHKHFTIFFHLLLLFLYFIFFSTLFLPTKFTHTHTHTQDPHPRPTTSTHYPRLLATLVLVGRPTPYMNTGCPKSSFLLLHAT